MNKSRLMWSTAILTFVVAMAVDLSVTVARAPSDPPRGEIAYETVYLSDPVGNARRVRIAGSPGGRGTIVLDSNECSLDHFGNVAQSTRKAPLILDVRFDEVVLPADSGADGRRLYEISGLRDLRLRLLIPAEGSDSARLLLLDEKNETRRVITLERSESGA